MTSKSIRAAWISEESKEQGHISQCCRNWLGVYLSEFTIKFCNALCFSTDSKHHLWTLL